MAKPTAAEHGQHIHQSAADFLGSIHLSHPQWDKIDAIPSQEDGRPGWDTPASADDPDEEGSPMATEFSQHCIYTIVHADRLAEAAQKSGSSEFVESKPWVTGRQLWHQAQAAKVGFPILLGDATDCSRLVFWGLLCAVKIEGDSTHFTVDRVRRLRKTHAPQELVLRSTGRKIAANFRRPYAICRTPKFLSERGKIARGAGSRKARK